MKERTMFCPQCQNEVTVTQTPAPLHGGPANLPDAGRLVCLNFGPDCRDDRCSVSRLPKTVMGVRLARSDLDAENMEYVQAVCEGCERLVELAVVDESHAVCPDCETVNRWATVRLDGEEWVAVTGKKAEAELD
jgi:hypothetical protein